MVEVRHREVAALCEIEVCLNLITREDENQFKPMGGHGGPPLQYVPRALISQPSVSHGI